MKYFLDTNVIIDMLKGKHPCMFKHFEKTYSTDIRIPAIVVAELEYGAAHSADYEKNKSLYEATNRGAVALFAAAGKRADKKDLGLIAMSYKNVYVGRIALADDLQKAAKRRRLLLSSLRSAEHSTSFGSCMR